MFNIENFDIRLDTKFIGRNFVYSEDIESTNTFLLDDKNDLPHGTIILSEFQSAGKGRLNRPWFSEKAKNLTFSILLKNNLTNINPNHINLAASLSVANAIENLYQLKTDLKWPNDVLIKNKKVSGILLESSSKGSELKKLVIGIGINVNQTKFVDEFKINPTSIKFELRREIIREKLISEILNVFENYLSMVSRNPKNVIEEWKEKCNMIGEAVTIDTDNDKKYGTFYDLDQDGFMLLKSRDKVEKITIGDILVRQ